MFVQNLPESIVKDEQLFKFFSQFGWVKNAKAFITEVGKDETTGQPIYKGKGVGFVCFETEIGAAIV